MLTESEALFERLCNERVITFRRIPTSDTRTPDYELLLRSGPVLVEVKQLEPNESDRAFEEELRTKQVASRSVDMGRARLAIMDAMKQLAPHARDKAPALVVLYDTMGMTGYLDPYSLSFALYGPEKVHFAVPNRPGPEPAILGMSRGGDAVATPKHNTTLSALAVLYAPGRERSLELQIFHNCNARIRLPLDAFSEYGFRQFEFDPPAPGQMPEWIQRSPT